MPANTADVSIQESSSSSQMIDMIRERHEAEGDLAFKLVSTTDNGVRIAKRIDITIGGYLYRSHTVDDYFLDCRAPELIEPNQYSEDFLQKVNTHSLEPATEYYLHTRVYDGDTRQYHYKLYRPHDIVPMYIRRLLEHASDKCVMQHVTEMTGLVMFEDKHNPYDDDDDPDLDYTDDQHDHCGDSNDSSDSDADDTNNEHDHHSDSDHSNSNADDAKKEEKQDEHEEHAAQDTQTEENDTPQAKFSECIDADSVAKRFAIRCRENMASRIEENLACTHSYSNENRVSLALIQPVRGIYKHCKQFALGIKIYSVGNIVIYEDSVDDKLYVQDMFYAAFDMCETNRLRMMHCNLEHENIARLQKCKQISQDTFAKLLYDIQHKRDDLARSISHQISEHEHINIEGSTAESIVFGVCTTVAASMYMFAIAHHAGVGVINVLKKLFCVIPTVAIFILTIGYGIGFAALSVPHMFVMAAAYMSCLLSHSYRDDTAARRIALVEAETNGVKHLQCRVSYRFTYIAQALYIAIDDLWPIPTLKLLRRFKLCVGALDRIAIKLTNRIIAGEFVIKDRKKTIGFIGQEEQKPKIQSKSKKESKSSGTQTDLTFKNDQEAQKSEYGNVYVKGDAALQLPNTESEEQKDAKHRVYVSQLFAFGAIHCLNELCIPVNTFLSPFYTKVSPTSNIITRRDKSRNIKKSKKIGKSTLSVLDSASVTDSAENNVEYTAISGEERAHDTENIATDNTEHCASSAEDAVDDSVVNDKAKADNCQDNDNVTVCHDNNDNVNDTAANSHMLQIEGMSTETEACETCAEEQQKGTKVRIKTAERSAQVDINDTYAYVNQKTTQTKKSYICPMDRTTCARSTIDARNMCVAHNSCIVMFNGF